jgi:hypothetical protein
MQTRYPDPDYRLLLKTVTGMAVSLTFLHWVPDIATWIHAHFYGEKLVVNERTYRAVLFVAYLMAGIATSIHVAGVLWATWHSRQRKKHG